MSSITGIFLRDGKKVKMSSIHRMNRKLAHRGPDGSNIWFEGSMALGHQMLHSTPESMHEKLPYDHEESGLVITADARIDNRKELSDKLGIEDEEHVSDSFFILKAYEMWGEKCPEELLGDFAFAIWDKNNDQLFCARDHMGIKPFYYYICDDIFMFATEIKALFAVYDCPYEINEYQVSSHLTLLHSDKKHTSFKNIFRLPAAQSITLNNSNSYFREYWDMNPNNSIDFGSDDEYGNAFKKIFFEAVKCRLRSAFPVGSMLSGGLDSSSIVCTANEIFKDIGKKDFKTFSAIFPSVPDSNEIYYIQKVLEATGLDSYFINADEIGPLKEIANFIWYGDQFLIFPNTFMSWNLYRKANSAGVRILLDGLEGDIVVSRGKGIFIDLLKNKNFKKLLAEINSLSKRDNSYRHRIFLGLLNDFLFKRKRFLWLENLHDYRFRTQIIIKEFAESTNINKKIFEINKSYFEINDSRGHHYSTLKSGLIQNEMESVDWMAAPFNIEPRHPFFDKRLVEFCLSIPPEQKFSKGWDRYIMRNAMSNILPAEVQWRRKKGNLSYNHINSMLKYEKEFLDKLIMTDGNLKIDKYVDRKKLQKIYMQYKSGKTKNRIFIWLAITLNIWLQEKF